MSKLFISHASADRQFVDDELVGLLKALGFEAWYGNKDIQTGEDWERSIRSGLESSQWFILVVSPESSKSDWVKGEVGWAMRARPNRIIPIQIGDCDVAEIHIRLPRVQMIDFRVNQKRAREDLIRILVQKEYNVSSLSETLNTFLRCPSKEILTVIRTETDGTEFRAQLVGANEHANDFFGRRKGISMVGADLTEIFETISQWIEPKDFKQFLDDQKRLDAAVQSGEELYASVPMKIGENHPMRRFRGGNFLPISIAYSGSERIEQKSFEYFLIIYLEVGNLFEPAPDVCSDEPPN